MTSTEWETMMREALTDEGWAEVTADIPEVNFVDVDELAMCERCAALIWPGYRGNHAAWHRQLTIAIKAQGLLQARMLTVVTAVEPLKPCSACDGTGGPVAPGSQRFGSCAACDGTGRVVA